MTRKPYIAVLSTGRCGSLYLAKVFQESGLDCGWEQEGENGCIGWQCAAPGVYMPPQAVILHQTRSALVNISSFQSFTTEFWRRLRLTGQRITGDLITDCMLYYYEWNRSIMTRTDKVFFIDRLRGKTKHVIESEVGRELRWYIVDSSINRRPYRMLCWEELIARDAQLAARCEQLESELSDRAGAFDDSWIK